MKQLHLSTRPSTHFSCKWIREPSPSIPLYSSTKLLDETKLEGFSLRDVLSPDLPSGVVKITSGHAYNAVLTSGEEADATGFVPTTLDHRLVPYAQSIAPVRLHPM